MRVVDLEKFVREDVFSPYYPVLVEEYPSLPDSCKRVNDFSVPDTALCFLKASESFRALVFHRLERIGGVVFPCWVDHALVEYLVENNVARVEKRKINLSIGNVFDSLNEVE